MANFADFKKKSKDSVTFLASKLEEMNAPTGYQKDERFWSLSKDEKTGNGFAIIRFLPAPPDEDLPFVKYFTHSFKVGGKYYYENCPTSLPGKQPCPACEENNKFWNSGLDSDKAIARLRKRRVSYISNILVINDPKNPENNGKVFLFRYGIKLWEKINSSMHPEAAELAAGVEPINPFDLWTGRNFHLKSKNIKVGDETFPNYDDSGFLAPSPLHTDDKQLEAIWKKEYSLQAFLDPACFKPYADLKARYAEVCGDAVEELFTAPAPVAPQRTQTAPKTKATAPVKEAAPFATDDAESSMSFFNRLSKEDE